MKIWQTLISDRTSLISLDTEISLESPAPIFLFKITSGSTLIRCRRRLALRTGQSLHGCLRPYSGGTRQSGGRIFLHFRYSAGWTELPRGVERVRIRRHGLVDHGVLPFGADHVWRQHCVHWIPMGESGPPVEE